MPKQTAHNAMSNQALHCLLPILLSDFRDFVFFVSKGNPFLLLFYSTIADIVPCDGRKKSPRTSAY